MSEERIVSCRAHCARGRIHLQAHDGREYVTGPNGPEDRGFSLDFFYRQDADGEESIAVVADGEIIASLGPPLATSFGNALTLMAATLMEVKSDPKARANAATDRPRPAGADAGKVEEAAQDAIRRAIEGTR